MGRADSEELPRFRMRAQPAGRLCGEARGAVARSSVVSPTEAHPASDRCFDQGQSPAKAVMSASLRRADPERPPGAGGVGPRAAATAAGRRPADSVPLIDRRPGPLAGRLATQYAVVKLRGQPNHQLQAALYHGASA